MSYRIRGILLKANQPNYNGVMYSEECLKKMVDEYNNGRFGEKVEWNDNTKSIEADIYISNSYPNNVKNMLDELISYNE